MMRHGLKTVRGEVYTLSVRKSEVVLAPKDAGRLEALSDEYPLAIKKKVEYAPDKTVIRELLKSGHAVPDCELAENFSLTVR